MKTFLSKVIHIRNPRASDQNLVRAIFISQLRGITFTGLLSNWLDVFLCWWSILQIWLQLAGCSKDWCLQRSHQMNLHRFSFQLDNERQRHSNSKSWWLIDWYSVDDIRDVVSWLACSCTQIMQNSPWWREGNSTSPKKKTAAKKKRAVPSLSSLLQPPPTQQRTVCFVCRNEETCCGVQDEKGRTISWSKRRGLCLGFRIALSNRIRLVECCQFSNLVKSLV